MPRIRSLMLLLLQVAVLVPCTLAGAESLRDVPVYPSGTDFALRFVLDEQAHPLVVHIDPLGQVRIVHPDDDALDQVPAVEADHAVTLPDPSSGSRWTLSGTPGYETFVLVASRVGEVDLFALAAELRATADATRSSGGSRSAIVSAIEAFLQVAAGPTRNATLLHLP